MLQKVAHTARSWQTHVLIVFVVFASIGAIAYVQIAVKRIEGELPLRVMQEKRDMEKVARGFYEFLATTEATLAHPTDSGLGRLRENLDIVARDLRLLRERYTFDTLIGASALHATLSPVLDDVQIWLIEGFGDVPPSSSIVLEIVATRARDALSKVYDKTTEADRIAYEILQQQSSELRQLRTRMMVVLVAFALLVGGFVWVAIRQRRASSARARAEEERHRAQSRLQDALESTSEGFAFFDATDRLVISNSRYRDFFLRDVRHAVEPGAAFEDIMRAAANRDMVVESSLGSEDWLAQRIARYRNPAGPFAQRLNDGRWIQVNERKTADGGTVAIYSDITPLKEREIALLEAKEGAETASEAKSTFLANVSHELRTPLTSIVGFARLVQKRLDSVVFPVVPADDPRMAKAVRQVRENIDIMLIEGQRLSALVNNVLDLEKIEAGKVEWNIQPVDITDVIRQAAAATQSLYEQKGLTLSLDVAGALPPVRGDRDRLVQVVVNLISNAVKFTDDGSIECRAATIQSGAVCVSVSDTGAGISPGDQLMVFEKFRQVGDTLTDKPTGTGLGLSICKEIVEHLGGTISVESVLGEGSTFRFTLPVAGSTTLDDGLTSGALTQ